MGMVERLGMVDWRLFFPAFYFWYALAASATALPLLAGWARWRLRATAGESWRFAGTCTVAGIPADFAGIALCGMAVAILWMPFSRDGLSGARFSYVQLGGVVLLWGFGRTLAERLLIPRGRREALRRGDFAWLWGWNCAIVLCGLLAEFSLRFPR